MHMGASTWQSMPPAAAAAVQALHAPPRLPGAPIGTGGGHSDHYASWATYPPPMAQACYPTGNLLGLPGTLGSGAGVGVGVGVGAGQTAPSVPSSALLPLPPQQQLPYSQMPGTMAHHAVYLQQLANAAAAASAGACLFLTYRCVAEHPAFGGSSRRREMSPASPSSSAVARASRKRSSSCGFRVAWRPLGCRDENSAVELQRLVRTFTVRSTDQPGQLGVTRQEGG
jgi:hypothetical protein